MKAMTAPNGASSAPTHATLSEKAAAQAAKNARGPERGPVLPDRVPWRAVIVFLAIAFGASWLIQLPMWLSGEGLAWPWFGLTTLAMMFTPALAAIIVVTLVRRPSSILRLLGLTPMRPASRTVWMTIGAAAGFALLPLAAMFVGWAFGWLQLDLAELSGFREYFEVTGTSTDGMPMQTLLLIQLAWLPIAVVLSSLAAFGEELGWRGWLLPNLRPLGTWAALILSGVVWGLWHAPIILLGYNYGRTDLLGLAAMIVWCVLLGIVIGWTRLRSSSVWPAVLAHGAINAATNSFAILLAAGQTQDIVWGTILGWPGWMLLTGVILLLAAMGQFRKQPLPGLTLAESVAVRGAAGFSAASAAPPADSTTAAESTIWR